MKKIILLLCVLFFSCQNPAITVDPTAVTVESGDVIVEETDYTPIAGALPKYLYVHIPTPFVATDNTTTNITTKITLIGNQYVLQSVAKVSYVFALNKIVDSRGNIWNITKIRSPVNPLAFNALTGLFYDGLNPVTSTVNYYVDLQMSGSTNVKTLGVTLIGIKFPYYINFSETAEDTIIDESIYVDSPVIVFTKAPSF